MKKDLVVRESWSNRVAGSSKSTQSVIITNRPVAVTLGPLGPCIEHKQSEMGRVYGSSSYEWRAEVTVDEKMLGTDGFVAVLTQGVFESCGSHPIETVEPLAGREVSEADIFFGSAYAQWAERMKEEAFKFLEGLASEKSKRVRHSLRYAAGVADSLAPHAERRKAWRAVLLALGFRGDTDVITKSVRTAHRQGGPPARLEPQRACPEVLGGPAGRGRQADALRDLAATPFVAYGLLLATSGDHYRICGNSSSEEEDASKGRLLSSHWGTSCSFQEHSSLVPRCEAINNP